MRRSKLVFEKVGDIHCKYPYLCVYDEVDDLNPFMEIGLTDDGELRYQIYPSVRPVFLELQDWKAIQAEAEKFHIKELNSFDAS